MLHLRLGVLWHATKSVFSDQVRIYHILTCVLLWLHVLKILVLVLIIVIGCLWLLQFITKTKMRKRKILKEEIENHEKTDADLHIKVNIYMASASSYVVSTF